MSARPISSPDDPAGAGIRRALVVTPDGTCRHLCRSALDPLGFLVEEVESGLDAVIATRVVVPNLILVGPQLRDVPGSEAIAWLRANPALDSTPLLELAAETGADPMPGKLVSPRALRRLIQAAMRLENREGA